MTTNDDEVFGFDGVAPNPCSARASRLANAMIALMDAQDELNEAKKNAPDYTGQWSQEDFYANEQEAWYRAAEEFEKAVDMPGRPD